MAEIVMQTNKPDKAVEVLKEVLKMEASRLQYGLNLAKRKLRRLTLGIKVVFDLIAGFSG
jgi:hypothetical protein